MKTISKVMMVLFSVGCLMKPNRAESQTLIYSDNFDTDSSANWTVVGSDAGAASDYNAYFATNYQATTYTRQGVTANIPPAPNGGGSGLKLHVNKQDATAAIAAISVSPNNAPPFTNDYSMKVDMFLGYNGPVGGGTGSTEYGTFGINRTNLSTVCAMDANNPLTGDGSWFAVTGEGGAAGDYRTIDGAGQLTSFAGGFIDRDGNGTTETEVVFTGDLPTAPLVLMFPTNVVGETAGAPGKQWVQVEVRQRTNASGGDIITWLHNNYIIARYTNAASSNSGSIMLGNVDSFASIASPAVDNYVIFDNLRVYDLQGVADLPEVSISVTDDTATEPSGDPAIFTLTRTGSTASALTVTYVVLGTAGNNVDYTNALGGALSGTITFAPGDSSTNIVILAKDDLVGENNETVILSLKSASNYEVYDTWASVNVVDDGDVPFVSISNVRGASYELNTNSYGLHRILFSNPAAGDVTVNYTVSGTAVNGTHYETIPTSATFLAGSTTNEIYILPIDNADTVSNRTVIITLQPGAGYSLSSNTNGTNVIFNDDLAAGTGTLYSDSFEVDSSATWNINISTNNCDALFAFDYSAQGIPPAPRTTGGSTLGLRLRANSPLLGVPTSTAQFPGITVSPTGQSFTGDFRMRFDMWLNYIGPLGVGATGSTEMGSFGITRGTICQFSGFATSSPDAAFFGCIGDGQNAADYRVYTNVVQVTSAVSNVFAAGVGTGLGNNTVSYYSPFGNLAAPAAQQVLTTQAGLTPQGAPGMVWHDVVITKLGSTLIWTMDGLKIATINTARFGVNLSTNVFLGFNDTNGSQHSAANDPVQFALYDNLLVESLPAPNKPYITNIVITGGNVRLDFTNSVTDFPDLFTVRTASTVNGTYTHVNAAITELAPGVFRAETPYTGGAGRYYRIQR